MAPRTSGNSDVGSAELPVVLFVHQASELYGSDKVLLYIAEGIVARGRYRAVVVVPSLGPLCAALERVGAEVHVAEIGKVERSVLSPRGLVTLVAASWRACKQFDRIVASRRVAVVHSNTLAVLAGAAWALTRRVPHVWHVHEIILKPRLVSWAFPKLVRMLADRVIANSTLTARWLFDGSAGLRRRTDVIFNGLPPIPPVPDEQAVSFRRELGIGSHQTLVVLAGRLNQWKGQDLLLEAVAKLRKMHSIQNLAFAMVGDAAPGNEARRDELIALRDSLGLGDVVSFVPFVDDIRPVWQAADIGVVPSTEPEPFGMVAIEAMAAGKPVVAAAHGGLLDIVVDNETGILVEPRSASALADALHRLAGDRELRHRMGMAGRKRVQAVFGVEGQVIRTEAIYNELSGGDPSRQPRPSSNREAV